MGKRVALLVGQGGPGAADEIIKLAQKLGAGIAKAWQEKVIANAAES